jgi:very-short-patch-repair endonuclease
MELLSAAFWIMAREHHWLQQQQQQQQQQRQMLRPLLPQQQPLLPFDDLLSAVHVLWAIANLNVVSMAGQVQAAGLQELSAVHSMGSWPQPQGNPTDLGYLQRLVYYVHAWLLDVGAGDGSGLAAGLTAEQLEQCKSALRQQLQQRREQQLRKPTKFQTEVRAAVSQLPGVRQGSLQYEELVDGLVLVDVVAEMNDGRKLAVEADGATHFTHQHGQLTGSTLHRNRALAARGYVVVSVNNKDWPYGSSPPALCAQQALLQKLVKDALIAYEARSTAH